LDLFIPSTVFPLENKGQKEKWQSPSTVLKPKRAKVLARRLKLHSLEKTIAVLATEKMEIV
jgi:hypothetical protein